MTNQMPNQLLGPVRAAAVELPSDTLDLVQLGRTLWRGKLWIAVAVVLFVFAGWYYAWQIAVPRYTAAGAIVLEPQQSTVVDLESVASGLGSDQMSVNTEAEVLMSRRLMGLVVDKLGLMDDAEFNPFLGSETPPPVDAQRDVTIRRVTGAFGVTNVRSSYVFRISAVTGTPRKSADLVNALADVYVADQLQVKFDATQAATEWLTERVGSLKLELEQSETAVQDFVADTDLVSTEALEALSRQIKDTRARLAGLTDTRTRTEAKQADLRTAIEAGDAEAMAEAGDDFNLRQLVSSGAATRDLVARAEVLLRRWENDLARTVSQADSLAASVAELEARYEEQSADLVRLEQLRREAEASRAIYEYFLTRLKETAVQEGIQKADARVLSYAAVPTAPSEPRKMQVLMLAVMLGLLVGAAAVLTREVLNTGFRTAEQLERETNHTVFGQIPRIQARKRRSVLEYLIAKPTSAAAEAVRNLRTSILLSNVDSQPKVLVSTSAMPGEGKTTVAVALAQNFAGLGQKVLLMEGDIRRRVFDAYFDLEKNDGLLSVLSGSKSFEAAVQHVDALGVDVLIGGKSTTNAADLFSSERFATLIKGLRKRYDVVIIDMPPVLLVPDTRIVAQISDAVLFSVKWDHTSRAQVAEAIRQFELGGTSITGLVLTQIDPKGMRRYGYGGRYGAYGAYQSKYYTS